ncbi:autotransporter domain-containing protein [Bradyrhizobium sp. GCM10027634]|uniref:autotransporter family protein n=1 Tax=unclassified Bradyrhizobium TaxID=2631580 RepID=UPI001FF07C3F|nr:MULTISPECIES: autotransporter domain-containing protein [unclassified Bradyrhizobium]MDN5000791.1 autotransporter domain-containing protein [Bradyrhizobium sp. WYCCWR 12677]
MTSMVIAVAWSLPNLAWSQDATWISNPGSGNWNDPTNWSPTSVPSGTATFSFSNQTTISFSSNTGINNIQIGAGAPNYVFNVLYPTTLFLQGDGITGSSSAASINLGHNTEAIFLNASSAGSAFFEVGDQANLRFRDSSTAGAAQITNTLGTVQFHDNSSADHATIVNNGVAITFQGTSTAGNAIITNNSTLEFDDVSSAGTATIVSNGSLQFHNGSTADGANITNNGFMYFVQTSTAGNAAIRNSAVIDFSLATGSANDHNLAAGSISGTGSYFLGTNTLTVGSNNMSTEVQGNVSDCGNGTQCLLFLNSGNPVVGGSLTKVGTGTLTLSGTNTYTGATNVNAGTLMVNGSVASSVLTSVNVGGMLAGNGVVGNTFINGGALSPGNSVGTLTVQGSLAFTAASNYLVEVSPVAADRTSVTGTATLNGATVNATFAAGTYLAKRYTIINAAAGISGTFAGPVNTNLPTNFGTSLSYDANDVFLNLTAALGTQQWLSGNRQNVANAIDSFVNSRGALPPGFVNLFGQSGTALNTALSQLGGEPATAAQQTTFDAMSQFMSLLTDPRTGRGNSINGVAMPTGYAEETDQASAYAASKRLAAERDAYAVFTKASLTKGYQRRWSVWSAGFGGSQTTNGNATVGSNDTRSSLFGTAVGADYLLSPRTIAGFALAGGGTNFSVNNLGSGRSNLFQAGAFVHHTVGAAYITGALAYGWQDITTDRIVSVAGLDHLRAQFKANAWSGRIEGGYRFVAPVAAGIGIAPYAAAQFVTFDLPAYMEQAVVGANTFALGYNTKSVTDGRSELGIRTDKSFAAQGGIFTLRGRLAWAHDFDPDRNLLATFQTLPGASFVVNGATHAADSVLTTTSAEWKWINGWSAGATFEGEFSNVTSYAGKGIVRYEW